MSDRRPPPPPRPPPPRPPPPPRLTCPPPPPPRLTWCPPPPPRLTWCPAPLPARAPFGPPPLGRLKSLVPRLPRLASPRFEKSFALAPSPTSKALPTPPGFGLALAAACPLVLPERSLSPCSIWPTF